MPAASVVINEVMANNQSAVANGSDYPDWVELYNPAAFQVDLAGMSLTDNLTNQARFIFPPNTLIGPGGYLVVWCDSAANSPGLHTGFGFKNNGEVVALFESPARGAGLLDSLSFGLQIADLTIGRAPNGSGGWALTRPTPNLPNQTITLGVTTALRFNEWMATNSAGVDQDWFELYNAANSPVVLEGLVFTDELSVPANRVVPPLSFIDAGGFIQFFADNLNDSEDADHVDFRLSSSSGETLTLYASDRKTLLDRVTFGPQSRDVSQGRLPDGGLQFTFFPVGKDTPTASNFLILTNVVINEVLTHTDPPWEDAIELFNPTAVPVDISHWFLSNSKDNSTKFRIPTGTMIPPGGFKVFYEYQFNPDRSGVAPSFTLNSAHGDEVFLSVGDAAGNLTGYRRSVAFGAAENRVSFGRYQTSVGVDFVAMSQRTFGADNPIPPQQFRDGAGLINAYPKVEPVVITEIMFYPPEVIEGANRLDNTLDEFIELHNLTPNPVLLYDPSAVTNTWKIGGGVDFVFPQFVTLREFGYLLVVNFDPATNATQLAAFRAKFPELGSVLIFGPYSGKLGNTGDTIELYKPDPPQLPPHPDAGFVPYVLVEKIKYSATAPWPIGGDGTGFSLQRRTAGEYGNDPVNWKTANPTAGRENAGTVANQAPLLATVANQTVEAGKTLTFTAMGTDADVPAQTLDYSLDPGAPQGASIDAKTGVFTWTPTLNQAATTNTITVRVTDNGSPNISATKTFTVAVPSLPDEIRITIISVSGTSTLSLTWSAQPGKSYRVQAKSRLEESSWTDVSGDVSATGNTATKVNLPIGFAVQAFYRIMALD